jgi:hypothetical protein
MSRFPVHDQCSRIHTRTNLYEMDIRHWLRNLAELKQSGFSAETTPMLQLEADAGALRQLANGIDAMRTELTQAEKELKDA